MHIAGKFIRITAAILMLSTPVFSQDTPTKETILATVNGTDITLGHMLSLASRLPENYLGVEDERLFSGIIDQLIQQQLLSSLITEETDELRLAGENEKRTLYAGEAVQVIYAKALTDDAIQAEYTATYLSAEPIPEYAASHILVESEDEAKAIVKLLEDGSDFATLAKEKSTGPSGPSGGVLGWAGQGQFVPEFETAMVALEIGQVSAPVKTQFGWHLINLTDKRNKPVPDLETVRDKVEEAVRVAALDKVLAELKTKASVEHSDQDIDPSNVRKFELLKN